MDRWFFSVFSRDERVSFFAESSVASFSSRKLSKSAGETGQKGGGVSRKLAKGVKFGRR